MAKRVPREIEAQTELLMDVIISAVGSEIISRIISFISNKYRSKECLKKNLEILQHLLHRVHTVVEEAEGRYIMNPRMLMQLKTLTEVMFQGYHVLDTYLPLVKIGEEEVSGSYTWPFSTAATSHTVANQSTVSYHVQNTLENLERTVAHMAEFVVLLTGCERMFRSPYSSYLYIDNFMFGRQVEKQKVINILMQDNLYGVPTTLPIIGGCRVGKKTLVANICHDDRVHSYYSSILHFRGHEIHKIDQEMFKPVKTLVTIEFVTDVADEEWRKLYSLVAFTSKGSKIIIISRLEKLTRFGTVRPIRINKYSQEEYSYLFKVLAFGSANPMEHPQLALIAKELATVFQGSLVMLNVYASVLRNNLKVQFWTRILEMFRVLVHKNLAIFGEHPKALLEKDGTAVDITGFSLSSLSDASFRLMLLTSEKEHSEAGLPTMSFGDIIAGSMVLPKKFQLVWESRLPLYTVICGNCAAETAQVPVPPRKKRQKLCQLL